MNKKFICPICGYVHEGTEAPERCPQCKQIVEWKVADESKGLTWACEHVLGVAKNEQDPIIRDGLRAHFMGECTEVGQYLAMARQADREGYPEIAAAFRQYAYEEAEHASKFAELLGEVVWDTKTNLDLRRQTRYRQTCQGTEPRSHPRHRSRDGSRRSTPRRRLPRPVQPLL